MKNLNLGEYLSGINDKIFVLNETSNECAVEAMDILRGVEHDNTEFNDFRRAVSKISKELERTSVEGIADSAKEVFAKIIEICMKLIYFIIRLFKKIRDFISKMIMRYRSSSAVSRLTTAKSTMDNTKETQSVDMVAKKAWANQRAVFTPKTYKITAIPLNELEKRINSATASNNLVKKNVEDVREECAFMKEQLEVISKVREWATKNIPDKALRDGTIRRLLGGNKDALSESELAVYKNLKIDKYFGKNAVNKHGVVRAYHDVYDNRSRQEKINSMNSSITTDYEIRMKQLVKCLVGGLDNASISRFVVMTRKDGNFSISPISGRDVAKFILFKTIDLNIMNGEVHVKDYFRDYKTFYDWVNLAMNPNLVAKSGPVKALEEMFKQFQNVEKETLRFEKGELKYIESDLKQCTVINRYPDKDYSIQYYIKQIRAINKVLDSFRNLYNTYSMSRMYIAIYTEKYYLETIALVKNIIKNTSSVTKNG